MTGRRKTYRITVDERTSDTIDAAALLRGVRPNVYLRDHLVRTGRVLLRVPTVARLVDAREDHRIEAERYGVTRGHLRSVR